jgi:hypothetical protein
MKRLCFVVLLMLLFLPLKAHAAAPVEGVEFKAEYQILDDSRGRMVVREDIKVNFNEPRHGIYRSIPNSYEKGIFEPVKDLNINVSSVTDAFGTDLKYEQSMQNDNVVLKIGDPNVYVNGPQTYQINYSVYNIVEFYEDFDEIFWDINGANWEFGFESISADFVFPKSAELKNHYDTLQCFTGVLGSTASNCQIEYEPEINTVHAETLSPSS